jgi:hypothetical protein
MMTYFAQRRPTAREMLQHEWIRGGGDGGDGGTNQGVNSADGAPLADVKQEREPEVRGCDAPSWCTVHAVAFQGQGSHATNHPHAVSRLES